MDGTVRVKGDASRSLPWKEACAKIGAVPLTVRGKNPDKDKPPDLTNSGVGGVQMADVSVDIETGIVRVNKMVAVQDCGLVVDVKTAESQVYGALIMGISYALYEEKILDPVTGRMLNPNLEFYRLAGLSDIGELEVHMMTGKGYDERGVIGLGGAAGGLAGRGDLERRGQRHRRARAVPAAHARPRARSAGAEGGAAMQTHLNTPAPQKRTGRRAARRLGSRRASSPAAPTCWR